MQANMDNGALFGLSVLGSFVAWSIVPGLLVLHGLVFLVLIERRKQ